MIIKKLVLHNFRVFRGTHEIDLSPRKEKGMLKPIILFGGLNGAGKTSILTAVRFALYGRLAFEHLVNNQEYIDQLGELIHNGINSTQRPKEASVSLSFTYNKDGKESEFTVVRSWERDRRDQLFLQQDGEALTELNYDQCQGFLNELIPSGIADLFFFDGEKISALAEDESGKVLQTAVRRLLGLDLISKLRNDLIIYLKRQDAKGLGKNFQELLTQLSQTKESFSNQAEQYRFHADQIKINIEALKADIRTQEAKLSAQGGAFAHTKAQEQQRVNELFKEKEQLEKAIRHEFEGTLPFALAPTALSKLLTQLEAETVIKQKKSVSKELKHFAKILSKTLSHTYVKITIKVEEALNKYLHDHLEITKGTVIFDISERETNTISYAITIDSSKSWQVFNEARNKLAEVEIALENASINIQRAPDDEQLLDIFKVLRELDAKLQIETQRYIALLLKAKQAKQNELNCARQIQKLHDQHKTEYGSSSAIEHAQETIRLLDEYAEALTESRVQTLAVNFTQAYRKLARKEDLQISARINPQTFDVELVNEDSLAIQRKSLSAGEKQIYAIAILEALAKTSGRHLPVIIDTPLGRLDSKHRDKLIEYYFPHASHQVIILSTDTEVDEQYFAEHLQAHISHSYQIHFDGAAKSSWLTTGYFWEQRCLEIS
jgi:DNA sulfur modification protein DndD